MRHYGDDKYEFEVFVPEYIQILVRKGILKPKKGYKFIYKLRDMYLVKI